MAILTWAISVLVIVCELCVLAQPPPTERPWQPPTDGWPPKLMQDAVNGYPNPAVHIDRCQMTSNIWLCDPNKQLSGTDVTELNRNSAVGNVSCKCTKDEFVTVGIAVINSVRVLTLTTLREQMKNYSKTVLQQWNHMGATNSVLLFVSCGDKAVEIATYGGGICVENIAGIINDTYHAKLAAIGDLTSCYEQIIKPTLHVIGNSSFVGSDGCLHGHGELGIHPAAYIVPIVIIVAVILVLIFVIWYRRPRGTPDGSSKPL